MARLTAAILGASVITWKPRSVSRNGALESASARSSVASSAASPMGSGPVILSIAPLTFAVTLAVAIVLFALGSRNLTA